MTFLVWLQTFLYQLRSGELSLASRILTALVVALLGLGAASLVQQLTRLALRRSDREVQAFLSRVTHVGTLFGAALLALGIVGVQIAALATVLGALGLAVSLSLQDLAKNLVAGVYLLAERPFRTGDRLTVRTFTGDVEMIDLRTTKLHTEDGELVIVPNTIMLSEVVVLKCAQTPSPDS